MAGMDRKLCPPGYLFREDATFGPPFIFPRDDAAIRNGSKSGSLRVAIISNQDCSSLPSSRPDPPSIIFKFRETSTNSSPYIPSVPTFPRLVRTPCSRYSHKGKWPQCAMSKCSRSQSKLCPITQYSLVPICPIERVSSFAHCQVFWGSASWRTPRFLGGTS